jgi:hypothetical protein
MGVFINPPKQQSTMSQVDLHKWTLIFDELLRWGVDDEDANLDHGLWAPLNEGKVQLYIHEVIQGQLHNLIHVPKEGLIEKPQDSLKP